MMEEVDENERVEGWKEQLREEKREGGVDLRRQNMMRGSGRSGTTRVPDWMRVSSVRVRIETTCAGISALGHHFDGEGDDNMALPDPGEDIPGSWTRPRCTKDSIELGDTHKF
jgi:hypothetical protein